MHFAPDSIDKDSIVVLMIHQNILATLIKYKYQGVKED